jgi:hypothetical protein
MDLEYHFQTTTIHENSEHFLMHFFSQLFLNKKKLNKQNDWEIEKKPHLALYSLDLNIVLNVCFWHINEFLSSKIQSSHWIFPFLSNSFNLRIKLVFYKLSNKTQSHDLRHYILHIVTTNVTYYHCATVGKWVECIHDNLNSCTYTQLHPKTLVP